MKRGLLCIKFIPILKISWLFFLGSFFVPSTFAQQPAYFILGEKEFEGVQIYDVIQDNELNYWFATDQGFYKYDNYKFESIECPEMKGLAAFGFVKSKDGIIFCYNLNNQIVKIDRDKCSVFYDLKEDERSSDVNLSITNENKLLVITKTVLVFGLDGKKLDISQPKSSYYGFPFVLNNEKTVCHISSQDSILVFENDRFKMVPLYHDDLKIQGVLKFFNLNDKIYAISTANKNIYLFDAEKYSLTRVENLNSSGENEFYRFYNENDQLWIAGTVSGVRKLSRSDQLDFSEIYYNDYLISDVFKDSEGNMLLSTFNHGVLVIPNMHIPDVLDFSESSAVVSTHLVDSILLMGTLNGALLEYDGYETKILSNSGSRPLQAIYTWKEFPYILFDDGQIKLFHKKSKVISVLAKTSLKDAVLSNENTVYLAMNTGVGILKFENGISFESIAELKIRSYSIEVDKMAEIIYVATSDGLKIIDSKGKIQDVLVDNEPIFANDIFSFSDSIYVASKKQGILIYKNGILVHKMPLELSGRKMEATKVSFTQHRIFALTPQGFVIFNRNGKSNLQLNKVHGFSTNKIFDFEFADKHLWICHSKGVQKLDLSILNTSVKAPVLRIIEITVNENKLTDHSQSMDFGYDERNFRFVFSAPTLRNKENIRYHFKLEGYDNDWHVVDYFQNEITYNALAPGNYRFLVKAENQGVFSKTVSYSFSIAAPIYRRWWFIAGVAMLVLVIITLIYRSKLNAQRRKAQQLNELNASKLTAIQSQMNPHFIFNSLNAIQDLVLKGDIDNSYIYITKFSDLVRRTLSYSEKDFIEFDQELKLIELYLSLEKLRFKTELEFSIDKREIEDIMIPPMLIQPFI